MYVSCIVGHNFMKVLRAKEVMVPCFPVDLSGDEQASLNTSIESRVWCDKRPNMDENSG